MSAMFDEWAYHEVFEPAAPLAPVASKLDVASIEGSRRIPTVEVPEPELRPRSTSVGVVASLASLALDSTESTGTNTAPTAAHQYGSEFVTPLTRSESRKLRDVDQWLGTASPRVYDFDQQLWEIQMHDYITARTGAALAARQVRAARLEVDQLGSEFDWIQREISDVQTHDVEALRRAGAAIDALEQRREEMRQVRTVLTEIWDAQDRAARVLRGPATRAVSHVPRILAQANHAQCFLAEHPDFVDAASLGAQWRAHTAAALAIALAHVSHRLRRITVSISQLVKARHIGDGAVQALIYPKFAADARPLRAEIALLRAHGAGTGAATAPRLSWTDLLNNYFQMRESLIGGEITRLARSLDGFQRVSPEFEAAGRLTLARYRQLCNAEAELFEGLFGETDKQIDEEGNDVDDVNENGSVAARSGVAGSTVDLSDVVGQTEFAEWLNYVSDPLYSALRRIVLQENDINRLSEFIVLLGESSSQEPKHETESRYGTEASYGLESGHGNEEKKYNGGGMGMAAIAQDAQERLMFRASLRLEELIMDPKTEVGQEIKLTERLPLVEDVADLLGQVYQLLEPDTFNELAHRAVREVVARLDQLVAHRMITDRDQPSLHLFHVRQLLLFQAQIVEFDLRQRVVQELDFSGVKSLLSRYREFTSFRELVAAAWDSVPKVVETLSDAMEELFAALRRAVARLGKAFVAEVPELDKALPEATAEDIEEAQAAFRTALRSRFDELRLAVHSTVADEEVQSFLLDSAQEAVMDEYTLKYRRMSLETRRADTVMDIDAMGAWLGSNLA